MAASRNPFQSLIRDPDDDDGSLDSIYLHNASFNVDRPLVNSDIVANTNDPDDDSIAQQHQDRPFYRNLMNVIDPSLEPWILHNTRAQQEIDSDAAIAVQLQEQEYGKLSMTSFPPYYQQNSNNTSNSMNSLVARDAAYAAHLQAEENQKQQKKRDQQRVSNSATNQNNRPSAAATSQMPSFVTPPNPSPTPGRNHSRFTDNFDLFTPVRISHYNGSRGANPFRGNGRGRGRGRGLGHIENHNNDFGPDDYENLLELDQTDNKIALTNDQINRLPTERFCPLPNANPEENKCSICMDNYEKNQTLRRLPCLHRYHKDCIDNWLKKSNLCPICRTASLK
ncbi:unnamed protein product [Rotaria socialis]|uniref:RING-type domain-containing protein n=1 Tax=Rotaria socialis TaxID=392032 RepID=A0A817VVA3_9BILA|nr:unnamed protein product [Rotaria socialis]CAF4421358.1 unnamed protein product [Rotaria socialis]